MAKKKTISEEEHLRNNLQFEFKNISRKFNTIPNRIFKIGDMVEIGNLEYNHILEVYENGKFYKVLTTTPIIRYGKYEGQEFRIWYVTGTDMIAYRTPEERLTPPRFVKNEDIQFNFYSSQLRSLISSYYNFGIDTEPDYQRGIVWNHQQKVDLIDSIFNNIDIGKFVTIKREFKANQKSYEILDGKQRLLALIEFFEDRLLYNGLTYSQLNKKDQHHFENFKIDMAQTEPITDEQKYRYFLVLNTCGTPVDKNHLKKVEKMLKEKLNK